jgi:hypothetical protein
MTSVLIRDMLRRERQREEEEQCDTETEIGMIPGIIKDSQPSVAAQRERQGERYGADPPSSPTPSGGEIQQSC